MSLQENAGSTSIEWCNNFDDYRAQYSWSMMQCRQRIANAAATAANFDLGRPSLQRLAIRFADRALRAHNAGGRTAGDPFTADECGNRGVIFGLRHCSDPLARQTVSVATNLSEESKILCEIEG